jgi:hypothetical protein
VDVSRTACICAIVVGAGLLSGCGEPATAEDRAALVGLWLPENGTTKTVEFKVDGVFDYKYFATLRLNWEMRKKGEVELSTTNGAVKFTCYYKIEGNRLSIDNGSGETCVTPNATPPDPMALSFTRSP